MRPTVLDHLQNQINIYQIMSKVYYRHIRGRAKQIQLYIDYRSICMLNDIRHGTNLLVHSNWIQLALQMLHNLYKSSYKINNAFHIRSTYSRTKDPLTCRLWREIRYSMHQREERHIIVISQLAMAMMMVFDHHHYPSSSASKSSCEIKFSKIYWST